MEHSKAEDALRVCADRLVSMFPTRECLRSYVEKLGKLSGLHPQRSPEEADLWTMELEWLHDTSDSSRSFKSLRIWHDGATFTLVRCAESRVNQHERYPGRHLHVSWDNAFALRGITCQVIHHRLQP